MKKWIICVWAICLMLCGCDSSQPETMPTSTASPTLLEQGIPWNAEDGVLELPLELPGATGDLQLDAFGDNLLLWQMEYEEDRTSGIRLWLVEPEYGTVLAEKWIKTTDWLQPQSQEDRICLCSSASGDVILLDGTLEIQQQWMTDPDWFYWVMGYGTNLYIFRDEIILERNLDTGAERIVLEGVSGVYSSHIRTDGAEIWYMESGQQKIGYLNFETGTVEAPPFRGLFDDSDKIGDTWLCRRYIGGGGYRMGTGTDAWDLRIPEGSLYLTDQGILMVENGEQLYLFDREGGYTAGCSLTRDGFMAGAVEPVWNEALNGFLVLTADWDYTCVKLLFWDPEGGLPHEDLSMEPVDVTLTAEEEMERLSTRAASLAEAYGLTIRIGTDCQTDYTDFTACQLTEPEYVVQQLDILESALAVFPKGFLQQLCYDNYGYIDIHLISELTARPHYGTGGSYTGFVQPMEDHYLMVIDGMNAGEGTYFHELSHIIDSFLEWDSWQREDALFSSEGWDALNPAGFEYTWDYALEHPLTEEWEQCFIDSYSTINPTEDRARILEYGMMEYSQWLFEEKTGARDKLQWYAMCIRDAFDTNGWPEKVLWEQYL